MSKLTVESVGISGLLEMIRKNEWLIPAFQRDFVWSEADVISLALSVLDARPIGMATLWAQPDDADGLDLEPISLPDTVDNEATLAHLCKDPAKRPNVFHAVLDGRQRSTALAMVFGGLRATDGRRRFAGRFFLDVTQDEHNRVRFIKESEVKKRDLNKLNTAIGAGLFPLAISEAGFFGQWHEYFEAVKSKANYPDGKIPEDEELQRRKEILYKAYQGIDQTILAVYTVPHTYDLGEICEIFETLNTTGTRVSTVDLLHSWLYSDTAEEPHPIELRDWIDELGGKDGAIGWASRETRPELLAQAVTASYIALDGHKPAPRAVGGKKATPITSVKAGDLLATPPGFWKEVIQNQDSIAGYLGGFQDAVSGARFPLNECPYPVMMPMYVALRWHMDHDDKFEGQWTQSELDALFQAFFWRVCLSNRYDQGFLTQSASDLKALKGLLMARPDHSNSNSWASAASAGLSADLALTIPATEPLLPALLERLPPGATGKTLKLAARTRPAVDLLEPDRSVRFPAQEAIDLHHIYPQAWCSNNQTGNLKKVLDPQVAEYDYVGSIANLMPLTSPSNNTWRAQQPGQALTAHDITFANAKARIESNFISEEAFNHLIAATPSPKEFWELRASAIAAHLVAACEVAL